MSSSSSSSAWTCPYCTYFNGMSSYAAAFCHMCAAARPSISSTAVTVNLLSPPSPMHDDEKDAVPPPPLPSPSPQHIEKEEERRSSNPFLSFVYEEEGESNSAPPRSTAPPMPRKRPLADLVRAEAEKKPAKKACSSAMEDISAVTEEQKESTVHKWQNILAPVMRATRPSLQDKDEEEDTNDENDPKRNHDDDDESVNTYRFRLLVAVILSSRTQERVVREAIEKIAQTFPGRQFTVQGFAALESWEALSDKLSFVHMNKVKSRHICQSAVLISKEFGGCVPTQRAGLLRMAGIGPTLAPLLEFLYAHDDAERRKQKELPLQEMKKTSSQPKAENKIEEDDEVVIVQN